MFLLFVSLKVKFAMNLFSVNSNIVFHMNSNGSNHVLDGDVKLDEIKLSAEENGEIQMHEKYNPIQRPKHDLVTVLYKISETRI